MASGARGPLLGSIGENRYEMNAVAVSATLKIAVACDLSAMPEAQAAVARFAHAHGIEPARVHELELVIDEVVSNIVNYGFPNGPETAIISLEAQIEPATIALSFIDNGTPFNPLNDAPTPDLAADVESRAVGGLGIHLVKTLADACAYSYADGQNRLEVSWTRG